MLRPLATRDGRGKNSSNKERANMSSAQCQYLNEGNHTLGMVMTDKAAAAGARVLFQERALSGAMLSPWQQ